MDDNWDDGITHNTQSSGGMNGGFSGSENGRRFSAGRGFTPVESDNGGGGGWGEKKSNNEWGSSSGSNYDQKSRGGRGRGGGDRKNYRERNDDFGGGEGTWENANENSENGFGGGGGGRGGGGRGRGRGRGGGRGSEGGRGSWGDNNKDDGENPSDPTEKPREIYVPVERCTTEDELFTSTIASGVNFIKLDDVDVKVTGEDVPQAISSFEQSGLRAHLLGNIKKSGYSKPTPIQRYAIPIIAGGRDLMACAQTGSGKTAAFLLPMIDKIIVGQESPVVEAGGCQPLVVIVSPTRELAIQIYEQAKKFAHNSIVKSAIAYGGTSVNHQRTIVTNGCHILVATPGRLNDFVNHGHVSFASVKYFVLDEADRMLDMGFLPTVEEMLGHPTMVATGERQTLMFSATFPEEIQHLAGKFLHHYIFVAIGIVGGASKDVTQTIIEVPRYEKRKKLLEMLKDCTERTVIFVETKKLADFLAILLCENDVKCTSIHGDRYQSQREEALWHFKKGVRPVLVATGVVGRGLDIADIQHVINYDLPKSIDEYVHRIGRTGRVGNRGRATSFYDSSADGALSGALANILKQAGQEVPPFLADDYSGGGGGFDNFGGRDVRGDDFGQSSSSAQAADVDEDW